MNRSTRTAALRVLVVRRDNIGDLVCTTPLLVGLRRHFPDARICLLANSYNAEVVTANPNIDAIYIYTKLKHRKPGQSWLRMLWARFVMLRTLRAERFDYMIIGGSAPGAVVRTAGLNRFIRSRHVVAFADPSVPPRGVDFPITPPSSSMHEVEQTYRLLTPFGVNDNPPPLHVVPDAAECLRVDRQLRARNWSATPPPVAVHISARKPSNRWRPERYIELLRTLHQRDGARFMLFWSPGAADDARHPGDDATAATILNALPDVPIFAYPTQRLGQLIAGISVCERMICSDGGAMHIAAALGKPILCFFGQSSAERWHPWGVPYVLLQSPNQNADDVSVADALAGYERLSRAPTTAVKL